MLIFKRFRPQDVAEIPSPPPPAERPISPKAIGEIFSGCDDFVGRTLSVGGTATGVYVCWIDGTVSGPAVAEQVLRPLSDPARFGDVRTPAEAAARLDAGAAYASGMTVTRSLRELAEAVAFGSCAAVFSGIAFVFDVKTEARRTVQEPDIEKSVKGSKDAFTEALRVNTGLIRSRLRTPLLRVSETSVGRRSRTAVSVLWLEGAAPPDVPAAVLRRLKALDTDGAVLADTLDRALAGAPFSPFPQTAHTERPDKLAAALLEGRTAVLAEGMPMAFLTPAAFPELMRTAEDGAQHFLTAGGLRLLRWTALFITLFLPAVYLAMSMYHAEMIPTELLLSVIQSKQSVPFSTTAEILGMLAAFELLQEAGLRLPAPAGQTVSIIGALIVGQSAVEAKVISPIAVIVVALSGIAGYTMPSQDLSAALRLSRFALAAAGALAGMFGVALGAALLLWHLCSLECFGRAYVPAGREGMGVLLRRPPRRKAGDMG